MKFGKALILSACIIAPLFLVPNLLAVTGDPYQRKYVEGEVLVKFCNLTELF
jgi:hypothetical protein